MITRKYPILYIDVDGVLRDHTAEFRALGHKEPTTYYDPEFKTFYDSKSAMKDTFSKYLREAPIIYGVKEALGILKGFGLFDSIKILSSQWNPTAQEATMEFLRYNKLKEFFNDIIFVSKGDDKIKVLNSNPGMLIDDRALTMNKIKAPSAGIWISTHTDDIPIIKESPNVLLTSPSLFGITIKLREFVKFL